MDKPLLEGTVTIRCPCCKTITVVALRTVEDMYKEVASRMFKVKQENVTPEQRNLAKKVIHAKNYGKGVNQ